MTSTLPVLVVVLALTGGTAALWRIGVLLADWRKLRGTAAAPETERFAARLDSLSQLAWTVLFLVHFVLLLALAESKELHWRLSLVASGVALVCAACSIGSLVNVVRLERSLRRAAGFGPR